MTAKLSDGNVTAINEPMFKQLGFSQELYQSRVSNSKKLIFAAWTIEIIAASIGLSIAGLTAYSTYVSITGDGRADVTNLYLSMFVGALPFLMVAVVELMKIPLVTVAYHAKSIYWKLFFSFALIFLAAITFETGVNGFQRSFAAQNFIIDADRQDRQILFDEIENFSNEINLLNSLSDVEIKNQIDMDRERQNYENKLLAIEEDKKSLTIEANEIESNANVAAIKANLDSVIADIDRKVQLAKILTDQKMLRYNDRNTSASDTVNRNQDRLTQQRTQLREELNNYTSNKTAALANCTGLFGKSSCIERVNETFDPNIIRTQSFIEENNARMEQFYSSSQNDNNQLDDDLASISEKLERDIAPLEAKRAELSQEFAKQSVVDAGKNAQEILEIRASRDTAREQLEITWSETQDRINSNILRIEDNQKEIPNLQREIKIRRDEINNLNKEINKRAAGMQIYQIAKMWYNLESSADVKAEQVRQIVIIWFGSLAAIVAFTGIVLAYGAMVLKYEHMQEDGKITRAFGKLWIGIEKIGLFIVGIFRQLYRGIKSLRWLVISEARKKRAKTTIVEKIVEKIKYVDKEVKVPVEIIKEVPVEKIVIQEVPKETVIKEFVYVPFYTDDPSEIGKFGFSKVKISEDK